MQIELFFITLLQQFSNFLKDGLCVWMRMNLVLLFDSEKETDRGKERALQEVFAGLCCCREQLSCWETPLLSSRRRESEKPRSQTRCPPIKCHSGTTTHFIGNHEQRATAKNVTYRGNRGIIIENYISIHSLYKPSTSEMREVSLLSLWASFGRGRETQSLTETHRRLTKKEKQTQQCTGRKSNREELIYPSILSPHSAPGSSILHPSPTPLIHTAFTVIWVHNQACTASVRCPVCSLVYAKCMLMCLRAASKIHLDKIFTSPRLSEYVIAL